MTRARGDNVQIWATVSQEINDEIEKIADREGRKKTTVVAMLVEKALKERQRQRRKNAKDEQDEQ